MCGFDYDLDRRGTPIETDMLHAERLIVETRNLLRELSERFAPNDLDRAEILILANSLNNFVNRGD